MKKPNLFYIKCVFSDIIKLMKAKPKSFKKGRICKFPGCKHILSIYNPEVYCHIHQRTITKKLPFSSSTVSKI